MQVVCRNADIVTVTAIPNFVVPCVFTAFSLTDTGCAALYSEFFLECFCIFEISFEENFKAVFSVNCFSFSSEGLALIFCKAILSAVALRIDLAISSLPSGKDLIVFKILSKSWLVKYSYSDGLSEIIPRPYCFEYYVLLPLLFLLFR